VSGADEGGPHPVRLRMLGHPLHASFVHVPLGILVSVAVWDALALSLGGGVWWTVAFWSLALGTAATLPAIATGLLDFGALPDGSAADRTARRHMYAALAAVACYGTSLILRGGPAPEPPEWTPLTVALSYVGLGLLGLVGWLGGELVFRHRVGTR
jgi:uncharacterized membrane protein